MVRICTDLGLPDAQEYANQLKKAEKMKEVQQAVRMIKYFLYFYIKVNHSFVLFFSSWTFWIFDLLKKLMKHILYREFQVAIEENLWLKGEKATLKVNNRLKK